MASVKLCPTRAPAVAKARKLPPAPDAAAHVIALSDAHHVPSLPLSPARIPADWSATPRPPPRTVTVRHPPACPPRPTFDTSVPPAPIRSYDKPSDLLPPVRPPTLTTSPLLPESPTLQRDATDVPDNHTVVPLADPPLRAPTLYPVRMPKPLPAIVVTPPPMVAPFPKRLSISNAAPSYDTALLPLPTCVPTVTAPIPLPPAPADRTHATPVSDTHRLPSHVEPPPRTAPLPAPIAPAQVMPTAIPPRPAPPPPLTPPHTPSPVSADTAVVRVPALDPIVTTTDTLPPSLVTARHCTPVHDAHSLLSQALAPTRAPTLHPPPPQPPDHSHTTTAPCPVPPRPTFVPRPQLTPPPPSYVAASDTLPTACTTVNTTLALPPPPCPVAHTTELSANHSVASAPVCPARPPTLPASTPSPDPPIPTAHSQRPPAPAPLLVDMLDPCHTSYDSPIDVDPT